jgi:SNF2 family DNA or RNA helicase
MGLGKTVISISLLCDRQYEHTLVVLPLPIITQWYESLRKFTDLLPSEISIYHGKSRKNMNLRGSRVILTTYDIVRRDLVDYTSVLSQFVPYLNCLILDEAHKIRNKKTKTNAICELLKHKGEDIWLLTGTVIMNKYEDFSTLRDYLEVGETAKLRDYYIHLSKSECDLKLPSRSFEEHILQLSKLEREEYSKILQEIGKSAGDYRSEPSQDNLRVILVKILRLRQCCNHPDASLTAKMYNMKVDKTAISSKFQTILDLLRQKPEGDSVVIFSQWTHTLRILSELLTIHKLSHVLFHGDLSESEREHVLGDFKRGRPRIMLINIHAGGVGIELTAANHVILLDSWWNTALEQQAIDRCYRIGQTKEVHVHRLYIKNSIEDWMRGIKESKQQITPHASSVYDKGHLDEILRGILGGTKVPP